MISSEDDVWQIISSLTRSVRKTVGALTFNSMSRGTCHPNRLPADRKRARRPASRAPKPPDQPDALTRRAQTGRRPAKTRT